MVIKILIFLRVTQVYVLLHLYIKVCNSSNIDPVSVSVLYVR